MIKTNLRGRKDLGGPHGRRDQGGEASIGNKWGDNLIVVELGEILLARFHNDPSMVFVLKIAEIDGRTVTVEYVTVETEL
jgi:hypothetical protein